MKKGILIFCTVLISFSLAAIGYKNWSNTRTSQVEIKCKPAIVSNSGFENVMSQQADLDLFYKVDSRYGTITKEKLDKTTSITDLFSREVSPFVESYQVVKVSIIHEGNERGEVGEMGNSDVLNANQRQLLQSADYSTNFIVSANCIRKNPQTGIVVKDSLVRWMTIVPEKKAEFASGYNDLIDYFKESTKAAASIIKKDKLQPGKVAFTITKDGTIENVKLTATSGYASVDKALLESVSNMPQKWNPATNLKGEKVNQELIFFFGLEGC